MAEAASLDETFVLSVGALQRTYRVCGPRPAPGLYRPAVLVLHGMGATPAWTLTETGWKEKALAAGFLAVLPQGTRMDLQNPPDFLRNPPVWQAGPAPNPWVHPDADDLAFLAAVLDDLVARLAVDPRRIYATGFSNGASMTFRLAAEHAGRLAAIAPVAGHCLLADPRPTRPVPTLFIVGAQDPLMPLEGGRVVSPWGEDLPPRPPVRETLQRWARALGCPELPQHFQEQEGVQVEVYGPGPQGVELRACTVEGLGHHWPGGQGQLKPRLAGPPSDRFRANDVIWDFFQRWTGNSVE